MIDHDRLAEIATRDPRIHALSELGTDGGAMVGRLIARTRAIYRVLSPEQLTDGLTIVEPLQPNRTPACARAIKGHDLLNLDELPDHYRTGVTVIPLANGKLRTAATVLDPGSVDSSCATYHFHPERGEQIIVCERAFVPENPTGLPSAYAVPTFLTLEKALRRYAVDVARHSQMTELRTVWRDRSRLMFHSAPEEKMRRSLESFLAASLRETRAIDIRPETPVDESHPIDLRVVFTHTNRTALIEIKWMGDSANDEGRAHVRHRDSRARQGAQQLADYLDADSARSTGHVVVGYLVLFDARRRRITPQTTSVTCRDGHHYREQDVAFQSELLARDDFATPLRMFMEPVCS